MMFEVLQPMIKKGIKDLVDTPTCSIEIRQRNGLRIGGPQVVFELIYNSGCNDKESICFQVNTIKT